MTDLKRSIAGVKLYVESEDAEAVKKIQKILDAAVKALQEANARRLDPRKRSADFMEALFGRKA